MALYTELKTAEKINPVLMNVFSNLIPEQDKWREFQGSYKRFLKEFQQFLLEYQRERIKEYSKNPFVYDAISKKRTLEESLSKMEDEKSTLFKRLSHHRRDDEHNKRVEQMEDVLGVDLEGLKKKGLRKYLIGSGIMGSLGALLSFVYSEYHLHEFCNIDETTTRLIIYGTVIPGALLAVVIGNIPFNKPESYISRAKFIDEKIEETGP